MKAQEILNAAAGHMQDRSSTYEKPEGERSMARAVAALNAITGRDMTEAEGWLLLQLLKNVRLFTRPGFHQDSAEDAVAYAALMGEAKSAERSMGIPADIEPAVLANVEDFNAGVFGPMAGEWPSDDRIETTGQNGNDGAAYAGKGPCLGCGGSHPLTRCARGRDA